jgi:hypothetical protein
MYFAITDMSENIIFAVLVKINNNCNESTG